MNGFRVVLPFRPFPPETGHHEVLRDFDWMAAVAMLTQSFRRIPSTARVPIEVITDVDTTLPVPALHFVTTRRRLMLWYVEIAAAYLESPAFDRDTLMLDSDQLVFRDLSHYFVQLVDLTILIRRPLPKFNDHALPILNGVQWWPVRSKAKLAAFYRQVLALAEALPDPLVAWGADTVALHELLAPLEPGVHRRAGLRVRMVNSDMVIQALSSGDEQRMAAGLSPLPPFRAVVDFRNLRKRWMRAYFDHLVAPRVAVA